MCRQPRFQTLHLRMQGIIEVLTSDGDSKLGGDDFDRAVAHWALQQCRQAGHALRWAESCCGDA